MTEQENSAAWAHQVMKVPAYQTGRQKAEQAWHDELEDERGKQTQTMREEE